MAHDTDGWPVRVYRYGAPGWGGKRAITISDHGRDQMQLAHRLRNELVEVAESQDSAMREWWCVRLPAETTALDAAEVAEVEAWAEVMRERSRQRRRDVTGPAVEVHRDAAVARRAAFAALKAAKAATRKADPDAVKAMTAESRDAARVASKALYQKYSALGLHWGTIGAVLEGAKTAEKLVVAARAKGKPARRRFARWDGSGRIAVQLQREAGDRRRTPSLIAGEGGKWRNVLRVRASEHGPRMRRVEFGTGAGRPVVALDVVWHRDIPADADITSAELVARRIAGQTRYHVCITARVAPVPAVADGPVVALHVGWRKDDGEVRVAAWRSDEPVQVPGKLAGLVTQDTPRSGRVLLPGRILRRLAAADETRGVRDIALDETRVQLGAWLDSHPQPPIREGGPELTGPVVRAWKSPGRFAAVALAWRADPRTDLDDIQPVLEEWRRSDRAAWEREAHGRDGAVASRKDAYRQVGAWIAATAGRILVDDSNLAAIAEAPKTGELLPGVVEDAIAGRRADVAAGDLRAAVVAAATRDGVTVETVPAAGLTITHHACGHKHDGGGRRWLSAEVICDGCGRTYDQDANATTGMLARAVQRSTP